MPKGPGQLLLAERGSVGKLHTCECESRLRGTVEQAHEFLSVHRAVQSLGHLNERHYGVQIAVFCAQVKRSGPRIVPGNQTPLRVHTTATATLSQHPAHSRTPTHPHATTETQTDGLEITATYANPEIRIACP